MADSTLTRRPLDEHLPDWGVLLLESHHDVGFTMPPRTHPFLKILYVLQGAGTLHFDSDCVDFASGDCLLVPPGQPNWIEDAPNAAASLYICCISTSLLSFDRHWKSRFQLGKLKADQHLANRVASYLRRMAYAQSQATPGRPLAVVAEAMRLLQCIDEHLLFHRNRQHSQKKKQKLAPASQKLAKQDHTQQQWRIIERYSQQLRERFFEATTIDDAAESVGMSRRVFTRVFHEVTGETWLRFVRRLAIEHAIRLLRESDRPIVTIAFECGFNDLSTFYRQFKSQTACSPADVRRQAQESR